MAEYTFHPRFQEFVTLYRGVVRVWIGNGTDTGIAGMLYAEYVDGLVEQLGMVSDYEEAKHYFQTLGIDLTYEQWVALLSQTPENARRSEAWAVGTINGEPVSQEDETHENNAKHYANESKIWANGEDLDGEPVQPTDNATYWAAEAHGWANNGESGEYTETNNSKYWAEQSKEFMNGTDLYGNTVPEREEDNVLYYKNQAKLWANYNEDEDSPSASNNARYWAETSKSYTDGKDLEEQVVNPTNNAEYFKTQAMLWANNGTEGDFPSETNNAKSYSESSKESREESESWAKGTRDGEPDEVRYNAATDNALYYSEQSKLWASFGTDGNTPSASNNAKAYSGISDENRLQAESWAVGTRNGIPDIVRQNASTDNAKFYSNNADLAAQTATENSLTSESWAKGTRNGQADTVRQNAATDNSSYYCAQSKLWANFGLDGDIPTAQTNAKEYARQAGVSATTAEEARVIAVSSASSCADNATQSSASAAAALQSETNAGISETNARNSATAAGESQAAAAASATSASRSESSAYSSEVNAHNSEVSANQSEYNSLQYKVGAESAKTAAESARDRAETAVSRYPRIATNRNWEVWNPTQAQWYDTGYKSMAEATVEYGYQNSISGNVPPTGIWSPTPDPQPGRFLWTKMTFFWTNGTIDYFYNVSYIGTNGTGSVDSVNGLGGNVILDGTNIYVDDSVQEKETIYTAISRFGTAISNSDIDALF